ncbi:MAG: peptidoglycan bridge formation glycyltransferase FemA/FemB family protein [Oscillospiraceae bacterium]|nr:peptidoglycan bridge formation glycyltransferase FemA/FemB family protein [Oscillospiraceae bacterium]
MTELLKETQFAEYEAFVQHHPKGHFAQSTLWAKQKPSWRWRAVVSRGANGEIRGALAILFRRLPGIGGSLAYGCRGPVCDPDDRETLEELVHGATALCRTERAVALRLDPDIPASDLAFRDNMEALGFRTKAEGNLDQIQPKYVFRLPLAGRSEEEIFAAFHQKVRYNIRLSARRGVTVRVCGPEMVDAFSRLMEETGHRDGFITRQGSYFTALLEHFGAHARLYMAFFEETPIAGAIAIQYGDKTWYLYGASSGENRDKMPNYLLQWEMIRWALAGGSRIYDFRGVSGSFAEDQPLAGLYRFKVGFGGEFTEFMDEIDLVLQPLRYRLMVIGLRLYGRHASRNAVQNPANQKPVETGNLSQS